MSLNDLNISKKLTAGFAVVVIVVAAMCAAVFMSVSDYQDGGFENDAECAR